MIKDEWWPCKDLTLQGNLTIEGFAQKIWTAKAHVCEINLHAKSGMARIDWNHASVIVSPGVIQHATLDVEAAFERDRFPTPPASESPKPADSDADRSVEAPSGLQTETQKPLEDPNLAKPSRADEIIAEFSEPPVSVGFRRRGRKPKAD